MACFEGEEEALAIKEVKGREEEVLGEEKWELLGLVNLKHREEEWRVLILVEGEEVEGESRLENEGKEDEEGITEKEVSTILLLQEKEWNWRAFG